MFDKSYFDAVRKAQSTGEPVARYKKGIVGGVGLTMIDSFTGQPKDVILIGNINDPKTSIDDISITLWSELEHDYFRKANRVLLEQGYLVLLEAEMEVIEPSVNEVSDEVLKEALGKKYFAVKALLDKFTSPLPVMRMLQIAEDMNKSVGTVNKIKEKLSKLQQVDEPDNEPEES